MENQASSYKDKMGLNCPREIYSAILKCGSPGSVTVPVPVTRKRHASLSNLLPTSSAIHLRPYSCSPRQTASFPWTTRHTNTRTAGTGWDKNIYLRSITICQMYCVTKINPYPTAFPYGNGRVLHFYQQQESSTTKTVHKVINKGLKTYV